MYIKNLDKPLRVRLSEQLFNYLSEQAKRYNLTVSQYVRVLIETDYNLRGNISDEHK